MVLQSVFWFSVFLIVWTYAGYPLALRLSRAGKPQHSQDAGDHQPTVSIITTVYNEQSIIGQKIENCLELDYPNHLLEFIFVSDGSTDATNEILGSAASSRVVAIVNAERRGKDNSQGQGVAAATGEIIVFTDARTLLAADAVSHIVKGFADSQIGCISGRDFVVDEGGKSGEGAYVKYEMLLRELETQSGSTIVVSGCFFAIRKALCERWHAGLTSDFYLPIHAHQAGFRIVQESRAVCTYSVAPSIESEFRRKVRTIVNGMDVLFAYRAVLNPFRHGSFAMRMINHKLFRWLVPFWLLVALISNAVLWGADFVYQLGMLAQLTLYLAALAAYFIPGLQAISVFRIALFFVISNLAILIAWMKFSVGRSEVIWEPTAG